MPYPEKPLTDRVIEAGWLALAAGLPLFIAPWGQNGFELPKAVLLWAVVAAMGAAWLVRCPDRGALSGSCPAPVIWLLIYAAVLVASTLLSVNPLQSAQGDYDRMQGALTLFCTLALFLMLSDRLRTPAQVGRLLAAIAWGSAPVTLYGLLQALNLDPLVWQVEGPPVIGTLGRSNFVGAYLVLVLPVTVGCAWFASGKTWRAVYAGLIAAQLACLVATMCRAAWLGILAAGGVALLAAMWRRGWRRLATAALCLGAAGLAGGLVALTLARGLTGSVGARGLIWRTTWPLIAARPLLGYGPETYGQVFTTVFPPELVYLQGRAVVVDRAHNLILDTLAATGAAGLLAYAALTGTVLVAAVRAWMRSQDRQVRVVLAVCLAAVAGHLVETQFSFQVTATAALFWVLLGVLAAQWHSPAVAPVSARDDRRALWPRRLLAVALLAVALPKAAVILVADASAGRSYRIQTVADVKGSIAAAERAVTLWPTQPAYDEHLSWLHLQLAKRGYNAAAEFQSAEAALDAALRLAPGNYRLWSGLGELYTEWGLVGDPARFAQADLAWQKAGFLFPGSAMVHTGWGLSLKAQGRIPEAAAQFQQAVDLDQTDAWAYRYLGDARLAQDDLAGAEEAYHHALALAPDDPALCLAVARRYQDMGRRAAACEAASSGLLAAPNHPELLAFLAGCE
ncbi:MAG: O-antigen ligase family protein [Anaerolineae bacterium]|nr:O-antigen ligase family protein [Anaerolineae bacterium]